MLKKINEGGVESDQGFTIQIIGPETIKYTNKNYSVKIDINYDPKNRKSYIFARNVNDWDDGNEKVRMSEDDKNLMIKNISEAVKLLTGNFEII